MFKTLILWGWDNVLIDTYPAILAAQNDMLTHFGKAPWTEAQSRRAMAMPRHQLIQELFGPKRAEEAWQYYLNSYQKHAAHIQLKPGAPEVLQTAKSRGFVSVLGSHKQGSLLRTEASTAGLNYFFDRMIGSGDTPKDKPDRAFVDAAVAGFAPDIVLTIGDTISDIQMARYFPKGFSLFIAPKERPLHFDTFKPDKTVADLFELRADLEKHI